MNTADLSAIECVKILGLLGIRAMTPWNEIFTILELVVHKPLRKLN